MPRSKKTPRAEPTAEAADRLLYRPLPTQKRLHDCEAPNVLFGGAAGGSKSHGLRWHLVRICAAVPGARCLLLRRQFKELEQTHLLALRTEVPPEFAAYDGSRQRLVFPNGAVLQFGHCNTDADFASYLSTEWLVIGVDEASQFTPYQLTMLPSRLRTTIAGARTQYALASNPGGPGHLWLKARFLDKNPGRDEAPEYDPREWVYIPSRVADNPYVGAEYVRRLEQLPAEARRAYLEGDWDVFAGQVFSEWRREIHVVADTFQPPRDWIWIAGLDWGYANNGYYGLFAVGPDERVVLWWEWVFRKLGAREAGEKLGQVIIVLKATAAVAIPAPSAILADDQMWQIHGHDGPTLAEQFQAGLRSVLGASCPPVVAAPKGTGSRQAKLQLLHQALRWEADKSGKVQAWGMPKFRVAERCGYWIRTVPALPYDPRHTEDVDTDAEDHAYDATGNVLLSRIPSWRRPEPSKPADVHPGYVGRHRRSRDPEDNETEDLVAQAVHDARDSDPRRPGRGMYGLNRFRVEMDE